jgi:hypothetical protein
MFRLMMRFTLCIMVGKAHSLGILSRVRLDKQKVWQGYIKRVD